LKALLSELCEGENTPFKDLNLGMIDAFLSNFHVQNVRLQKKKILKHMENSIDNKEWYERTRGKPGGIFYFSDC